MNKILKSAAVIAFVAAIAVGATSSYFSDTETSTGNTFTAGSLDLKVDSVQHYNGNVCVLNTEGTQPVPKYVWKGNALYPVPGTPCTGTWELTDLTGQKFFDFADLKPGDDGENTISLHVDNNDAWACMTVTPVKNDDMTCVDPEKEAEGKDGSGVEICGNSLPSAEFDGDLAQALTGKIWADIGTNVDPTPNDPNECGNVYPGDNKYNPECGDKLIGIGIAPLWPVTLALADKFNNVFTGVAGPLKGLGNYYIGVSWSLPGPTTGNAVQTDSYVADISFKTEQARNNGNFVCNPR